MDLLLLLQAGTRRLGIALLLLLGLGIPATEAADLSLMVYGDSLSAGYGMDPALGWVPLLEKKLAAEGLPFTVVNSSVSGETTTGGLSRLPSLLEHYQPDVVIVELGGNDGLRGLPLSSVRENLSAMVRLAQQSGATVVLAGIQIPPNYGPRYTQPFFEQYAEIAAETGVALVPFLIDGIPQQPELMQDDGIHPKPQAQFMILDNVWPILEPVLRERLDR